MKKNLRIESGDQLTALLQLVAEATKDSVREVMTEISSERKAQEDMSDELDDFRAPEDSEKEQDLDDEEVEEAEDEEEEGEKEKPKKDLTKLGSANPKPEKPSTPSDKEVVGADLGGVVKSLNKIRSGKSLKDEMTKRELNDYLNSLSDGERQSLYVFLDGLSQIMAGGVSGNQAPDPGKVGIKVNAKTKVLEPASTKKKRTTPATAKASGGQAAGETQPIIVGEVANKDKIRYKVRRLMKES
jgi:hypothetical protein